MVGWLDRLQQRNRTVGVAIAVIYKYLDDQGAYQFAQSFYDSLLSGKTVAQSAWAAREVVKANGDPTFLAYTVFAEPSAQIRV